MERSRFDATIASGFMLLFALASYGALIVWVEGAVFGGGFIQIFWIISWFGMGAIMAGLEKMTSGDRLRPVLALLLGVLGIAMACTYLFFEELDEVSGSRPRIEGGSP